MEDFEREQMQADALYNAIRAGDARKVADLMAQGASPDGRTFTNQAGQTPREYALALGDPIVVALFR